MGHQEQASSFAMKIERMPECGPHLEAIEACEHWFWDGNFSRVLECIQDQEERWLVEKGVMKQEDGWHDGAKDLLVGDVVYRIRTAAALEMGIDAREDLFDWFYVNSATGAEKPRGPWYALGSAKKPLELVTAAQLAGAWQILHPRKINASIEEREPGDDDE